MNIDISSYISQIGTIQIISGTFLGTILTFFAAKKMNQTYHLRKNYKPENLKNIVIPPELNKKYSQIELNQIADKKTKEAVFEFVEILKEQFPPDALVNFYNNINDVRIKENDILSKLKTNKYKGYYMVENNDIYLNKFSPIYHELFHMASSHYYEDNKLVCTGFYQMSPSIPNGIGEGINEGYTQFLTERYFENKHQLYKPYKFEVSIAKKLEAIIGKDKMEGLYLNANLPELITELKQYAKEDEIMKFITEMDILNKQGRHMNMLINHKIIKTKILNIYKFLLQAYNTKIRKELEQKDITSDEFMNKNIRFYQLFENNVKLGMNSFDLKDVIKNYKLSDLGEIENNNHTKK